MTSNQQSIATGQQFGVVRTTAGELRSTYGNGVYTFRGIRYGEDTALNRFRVAIPVRSWQGVRDAFVFGAQCLQPDIPDYELLRSGWDTPVASSEDCLFLNLWTPALGDQRRRPVMVNLHGGAFTVGNGNSAGRSGARFALHQDVVRVNINHRLGVFGFSYLANLLGPDYADSGNIGLLDIVLALHWVRDNIEAFGGDPNNVTIFGVSGGGGKVSSLMAMPAAKGLFHKASVESGSMLNALPSAIASQAAERFLAALNLAPADSHELLKLSGTDLLRGYMVLYPDGGLTSAVLSPVVDGTVLPRHPFDPTAPEISDNVPMLIGTTATEMSLFLGYADPTVFDSTWADIAGRLPKLLPNLLALTMQDLDNARRFMPNASPADVLFAISSEKFIRNRAIRQAERAAQRAAPVYMWRIEWNTPADGGKWRSPHGLSVPLVMDTVSEVPSMFGKDLEPALELSSKMTAAWAAFARTGVPNTDGLPVWPPYTASDRLTMIFNSQCRVESDPSSELRKLFP